MLVKKTHKGVDGSVFGPRLSRQIVGALDRRFPGEPLKVLGKFMKTEMEARIALSENDREVQKWLTARKEFSPILGMGFEDIMDEKDLKAVKEYLKNRTKERREITKVYKSLRDLLLFRI